VTDGIKNQYTMASTATAQAVTFDVPSDWALAEIELTDGVIAISGYGDPLGSHRSTSKQTGRAPNFTAISQNAVLGRVPSVVLPVEGIATSIADINVHPSQHHTWLRPRTFNVQGQRLPYFQKGLNLVRMPDGSVRKIMSVTTGGCRNL